MMIYKMHRAVAVAAVLTFAAMAPTVAGDKKAEGAAKGAAVGAAVGAVTGVGVGAGAVSGALIGGATANDAKDNKAKKNEGDGKPGKTKE